MQKWPWTVLRTSFHKLLLSIWGQDHQRFITYGSQLTQDSTEAAATQTAVNLTAANHAANNPSVADRASGQYPPHGLVLSYNHIKGILVPESYYLL